MASFLSKVLGYELSGVVDVALSSKTNREYFYLDLDCSDKPLKKPIRIFLNDSNLMSLLEAFTEMEGD